MTINTIAVPVAGLGGLSVTAPAVGSGNSLNLLNAAAQDTAAAASLAASANPLLAPAAFVANLGAFKTADDVYQRDLANSASAGTLLSDKLTMAGDLLGAFGAGVAGAEPFAPAFIAPVSLGVDLASAVLTGGSIAAGSPTPPTDAQTAAQQQQFLNEIKGANSDIAADINAALASNNPSVASAGTATENALNALSQPVTNNGTNLSSTLNGATASATGAMENVFSGGGFSPQYVSATVSGGVLSATINGSTPYLSATNSSSNGGATNEFAVTSGGALLATQGTTYLPNAVVTSDTTYNPNGTVNSASANITTSSGASLTYNPDSYTPTVLSGGQALQLTDNATGGTVTVTESDLQALDPTDMAGSMIGGDLAQLLSTNNVIANLATSSFFSTAGSLVESAILSPSLPSLDLTALNLATGFAQSFVQGAGGVAGGALGASLAADLGVPTAIGSIIGSTIGAAVFATVYTEIASDFTTDLPTLAEDFAGNAENLASGAAISLVEYITDTNPVTAFGGNPGNEELGADIGGLIGLAVGLGNPITTTVGQFVGAAIASLFGPGPSVGPNADDSFTISGNQYIVYNGSNTANTSAPSVDNNPSAQTVAVMSQLGDTFVALVNAEISALSNGGSLTVSASHIVSLHFFQNYGFFDSTEDTVDPTSSDPESNDTGGDVRYFGTNDIVTNLGSTEANYNLAYTDVLDDAVMRQLQLSFPQTAEEGPVGVTGGDPGMTMALENSLTFYDVNYYDDALNSNEPATETITQLNYDLQAEADYEAYQANPIAFLIGYALRDPTNAAADWSAEYARASLLQSVTVYSPGEGAVSINVVSTANQGGMGLLAYEPTIQPDDVSISRSGDNLILADAVSYYNSSGTLTSSSGSVTIDDAFSSTQPIINENGILGQAQFYSSGGYVTSYWTGIDLAGLIAPGFTGSINLGAIQRDDGETAAPNYSENNSYFLLINSGETVSISGLDADLAVVGSNDHVTLTNTNSYSYLTNNDTLTVVAGTAFVNIAGNQTTVTLGGNHNTLVSNGNSDVILVNDHYDTLTINGDSNSLTLSEGQDTATVNGLDNVITATGNDTLYVNGESGNTVSLSGTGNFIQTAGTTITFADGSTGTVSGGANIVNVGTDDSVGVTGNGLTVYVTGTGSTVTNYGTLGTGYSTFDVSGSSDSVSLDGIDETAAVNGSGNTLTLQGAGAIISVSGTGQIVQVSGATVSVAADTTATFNGTDHNTPGVPDYGNGNLFTLGASATLDVTGSNNWAVASSNDHITMSDQNDGVGATGSGNIVAFSSTNDYAEMSGSTLSLGLGATATLTGSSNNVTMAGTAGLSVIGSNNTITATGSLDTVSIGGGGNTLTASNGTVTFAGTGTPPGNGDVFQSMGIDYDSYSDGEYETPAAATSLQQLAATGANSVGINVTGYVVEPGSGPLDGTTIATSPSATSTVSTESDASILQAIDNAQADGLSVFLRPQVVTNDGIWVATILTDQAPSSSDVQTFFANYDAFILNYATLAAESGVAMFSIGDEMASLSGAAYESYWSTLIADVKSVFSAYGDTTTQLTYSAAFNEAGSVSFWGSLNVIGVNAYEALTNEADPTLAQLEAGWTTTPNAATDNEAPQAFYQNLSAEYAKPILFTEMGYQSVNGSNELLGSTATTANVPGGNLYAQYQEQSQALEAFFDVFSKDAIQSGGTLGGSSFVLGSDLWEWNPDPALVQTDDFSVQGKPALNVVKAWYGAATSPFAGDYLASLSGSSDAVNVENDYIVTITGNSNSVTASGNAAVTIDGNDNVVTTSTTLADGFNTFTVNGSANTLTAGAGGAIIVVTGGSNNLLIGGPAYTAFYVTGDDNTLQGGSGANTFTVNGDSNVLTSDGGYEVAHITGNDNSLDAGASVVAATLSGNGNQVTGGSNYLSVTLYAGSGNDVIGGSLGATVVVYGGSGNTFEPGGSESSINYAGDPTAVAVNLTTGRVSFAGGGAQDTLENFNGITVGSNSSITGGDQDYGLTIDGNGGTITGGSGYSNETAYGNNDVLTAATEGGNLTAYGQDDVLTGGAVYSNFVVGGNDDTLIGGAGANTFAINGSNNILEAGAGGYEVVNVGGNHDTLQGGSGVNTFTINGSNNVLTPGSSYEQINFNGNSNTLLAGPGNYSFIVYGDDNTVTAGEGYSGYAVGGGSGNELIGSGSNTDFLVLGGEGNTYNGSTGYTTLDYSEDATPVAINMVTGTASFPNSTSVDSIVAISSLTIGSNSSITGGASDQSFFISGSDSTLVGGSLGDNLYATGDGNTLAGGAGYTSLSAVGSNNVYLFGDVTVDKFIANGGGSGAASNTISFNDGVGSQQLWFSQSGNDLQIEELGSSATVTVQNWFSQTASQVAEITGADGLSLTSGVSSLVSAMATYQAANPSFSPGAASTMPTNTTLQNAITTAWHH